MLMMIVSIVVIMLFVEIFFCMVQKEFDQNDMVQMRYGMVFMEVINMEDVFCVFCFFIVVLFNVVEY